MYTENMWNKTVRFRRIFRVMEIINRICTVRISEYAEWCLTYTENIRNETVNYTENTWSYSNFASSQNMQKYSTLNLNIWVNLKLQ